jgi:hypothetical protein
MTPIEILSYSALNTAYLNKKIEALSYTLPGPGRDALQAEVDELKARQDAEKPILIQRSALEQALKNKGVIRSQYDRNQWIRKFSSGWKKIALEDAIKLIE